MAVTDKHDAQEVMIQLPWVVPTQPTVSTHIFAETNQSRVPLDLNVSSTDTTAIWSFVIAMMVAFILGVSATVIAIWYGRKSFKLTEMSFKTVVEQIKASEHSALDINTRLFEQQQVLKQQEYTLKAVEVWKANVHAAGVNCVNSLNLFTKKIQIIENKENLSKQHIEELDELLNAITMSFTNLHLYLSKDYQQESIITILAHFIIVVCKKPIEKCTLFNDYLEPDYDEDIILLNNIALYMSENRYKEILGNRKNITYIMSHLADEFIEKLKKLLHEAS